MLRLSREELYDTFRRWGDEKVNKKKPRYIFCESAVDGWGG
jgi:hypothetical protein